MFESDLRRDDTSGNSVRDLGELSELNLLIDVWHRGITVNRSALWWW